MNRAALLAALPQAARPYLGHGVDPAGAWLAWHDGLTPAQARSQARNSARCLGSSWPDRLPPGALIELADAPQAGGDPLTLLVAEEAARAALVEGAAPARLAVADSLDLDTRRLADMHRLTRRRAQQLKAQRVALAACQGVLL